MFWEGSTQNNKTIYNTDKILIYFTMKGTFIEGEWRLY